MGFKKHLRISQIYSFIATMEREMGMREKSMMEPQAEQLDTNSCCTTEMGNRVFQGTNAPCSGEAAAGKRKCCDSMALTPRVPGGDGQGAPQPLQFPSAFPSFLQNWLLPSVPLNPGWIWAVPGVTCTTPHKCNLQCLLSQPLEPLSRTSLVPVVCSPG